MIIKDILLNNKYMLDSYNSMVDSMYEFKYDGNKGIKTKIDPEKVSLVDYRTFSFFGMYNEEIYKLYDQISIFAKEFCKENRLVFERSFYYLFGNILDTDKLPLGEELRMSSDNKVSFAGLYAINDSITISVNGISLDLMPGSMILFDSNDKVIFNSIPNEFKAVYFQISPLEYLHRQYYQKWIPLI